MTQALERRNKVIVGSADHLAMVLRVAHARGHLLCDPAAIRPYGRADGTWIVKVPMLVPARPVRPGAWQRWRAWDTVAGSLVKALLFAVTLLALGLTLLAVAVGMVADSISHAGPALLGAGALIVLVALLSVLSRSSDGHKRGYGYHWSKCK
jgi:hypothetical protein